MHIRLETRDFKHQWILRNNPDECTALGKRLLNQLPMLIVFSVIWYSTFGTEE